MPIVLNINYQNRQCVQNVICTVNQPVTSAKFVETKFNTFNKQKQLDIILNGYDKDDEDFFTTNVSLQYAVQNFILKTKRFISFT